MTGHTIRSRCAIKRNLATHHQLRHGRPKLMGHHSWSIISALNAETPEPIGEERVDASVLAGRRAV